MNQNQKAALLVGGLIVAVLLFLVTGFSFFWGFRGSRFGMIGPGMMGGYGTMFLVPILTVVTVVVLGLIIWAVVAANQKSAGGSDSNAYNKETPLDILKRRYAQGEIDKEEYETKKKDLI